MPPEPDPYRAEDITLLVDRLVQGRADVRARHIAGANGIDTTRQLSNLVDYTVQRIHHIALQAVPESARAGVQMTVAATGGYGRRRLAPFSDIELAFIVPGEDDPILDAIVREMFFLLSRIFTDGVGLRVGYAYRTPNELEDLTHGAQTSLLDARLVVGDGILFHRFREGLVQTIRPGIFIWHKLNDRVQALQEYGDSVYIAEPNVKFGAGGLRDLHTAEWIMKATLGTGLDDPWDRLRTRGWITEREFQDITEGRKFLLRLRNALHWTEGRESDILPRARQPEVARQLGYAGHPGAPAEQALMNDCYHHTATIQRISRKVTARSLKSKLRLADRLSLTGGEIYSTDPRLIARSPSTILGVLALSQRYGFPLSVEILEQIGLCAAQPGISLDDPDSQRFFLQILRHPQNVYDTLRRMADLNLLHLVIPAIGPLMSLLPQDDCSGFTVGEHSLRVVRELERMRAAPEPDHVALAGQYDLLELPEVLVLAALLHHLGRAESEDRPESSGPYMAAAIGNRLGLDGEATSTLALLVRHHALMIDLVRTCDPSLPGTAEALVAVVPRQDQLAMLYLLSVAKLRTHSREAWMPVRLEAIKRLFRRATELLGGAAAQPATFRDLEAEEQWIDRQRTLRSLPEEPIRSYCASMPASYLLNTDMEKVSRHMRLMERAGNALVVDFLDEPDLPWTEMTVVAPDAPGLLARIAGVLYAHDVNVFAARVFTREGEDRMALDELLVERRNRPLDKTLQEIIARDIGALLAGELSLSAVLARECREMEAGEPVRSLHLRNDYSEAFSVVEVDMPDKKGLLFRLASAITAQGWVIHSARVGTRAGEVHDVFYVTEADGSKVEDEVQTIVSLSDSLSAGPAIS